MIYKSRRIFKTAQTNQNEIKDLLQFVLLGELLSPSSEIWLVTPWISNIAIFDNRAESFKSLDPSWGPRVIYFIDVLLRLMEKGSKIVIVTRPDDHCKQFIQRLDEKANEIGMMVHPEILFRDELHIKGILTDTNLLTGSMNLTYNGLEVLDEQITFDTDPRDIAQARINFEAYRQ